MEKNYKKLYRVTLTGMKFPGAGCTWGTSYVVADDAEEAYQKVYRHLVENKIGLMGERVLESIVLLADTSAGVESKIMLYL